MNSFSARTSSLIHSPPLAKFTNYQYGGRPLGLSFVKYLAQDGTDALQGGDGMEGMTQDQTM